MNFCVIHLMCKVIMLSLLLLLCLWSVQGDKEFDLDEACRKAKTEWDMCFGQNKECNLKATQRNVAKILYGIDGDPAVFDEPGKCMGRQRKECKPFNENHRGFVGVCRPLALEFDRTCSLKPCPYWSLKYLIRNNCVIGVCYSSAPRTLVIAAKYFVMVTVISLLGHSYMSGI